MRTQTKERIIDFVSKQGQVTAKSIIDHVGLTAPAVFRHLSKLISDGVLKKQGVPIYACEIKNGKYFDTGNKLEYLKTVVEFALQHTEINGEFRRFLTERVIQERFLKITPDGKLQTGTQAFTRWCLARKLDPIKTSTEYVASVKKFDEYKKDGLIDGMDKIKRAFPHVYLDRLYYLDFYTIERFGKTKLGELILYAKQSQNTSLIKLVVADVQERILHAITRFNIEAVGFIPPTVKRDIQFMKELEQRLHLPVPSLKITKVRTPITVPQKTLSKLEERVENARQSLVVEERKPYRNILLIDDAVGSGATINEIAQQIRSKNLCTGELIGLALTGSFNGFEIIQEA